MQRAIATRHIVRPSALIFFDNGFLRRFIGKATTQTQIEWQNFYSSKLKDELSPFDIIVTPFKFLEVLGIVPSARFLSRYPFDPTDRLIDSSLLAERLSGRMERILSDGIEFYGGLPELSRENIDKRVRYMFAEQVNGSELAQRIASDIILRFAKAKDLDRTIWSHLIVDDVQAVLGAARNDREFILAQLQLLRDLMNVSAGGWNISYFRLLRSIWQSIESRTMLNPGFKSALPLKKEGDLADVDYIHLAVSGAHLRGKKRSVTVFTCDPMEQVTKRVSVCRFLTERFSSEILAPSLQKSPEGLPVLRPGRIYVCDPVSTGFEIIRVKSIPFAMDYPDGALRDEYIKVVEQSE